MWWFPWKGTTLVRCICTGSVKGGDATTASATISSPAAAATAGQPLQFAYNRKMREADDICRQQGIKFIPIVAKTLGGWDKVAIAEVKKLMAAKVRHLGGDEDKETKHTFAKLSILLMRGNTAIPANRIPSDKIYEGS